MKVHSIAPALVQLAMLIAVRRLALPGDILSFAPANVVTLGEKRVLRFQRNKTGALVTVELEGELGEAIDAARDDPCVKFATRRSCTRACGVPTIMASLTLIHRRRTRSAASVRYFSAAARRPS